MSSVEIENPNKDLRIPEWINPEYFDKILQKDEPNYVKILKFTPVAAIPPGENFTSTMLRIHFDLQMKDGTTKHKTYIFKTELATERGGKEIKMAGIFKKELKMYHTYLPAFEALYHSAGWSHIQLAPRCLHAEETADGDIHFVFEDLAKRQFKNVDRIKGLDMEHMKRSLHKLAEFHAASSVYVEQNGPLPEEYNAGFISEANLNLSVQGFKVKNRTYKKAMENWGLPDSEKYVKSFPNAQQYLEICKSNLKIDPQEFNTLTHGDYWSSNLMCNYLENGEIDQIIMVDFQIGKWGSPAQDLLFFITLSAAQDIRLKEFDNFVLIYWERLVECLKFLKYSKPLPKLRELQMSLYKKNNTFYAFMAIFNHLPVLQFPTDKESNLHSLMRDDEEGDKFRLRLFTNPAFANIMKDLYPFYYNRGIFQFSDFNQVLINSKY
ncbi:uncharacterized protein Dwil_GK14334 [Drosophila willistoni]|uniref:CHK kinase-like domain-containing protein n=1 Tax=Drosophila willistoni TaxID=7260 RepID=B4NIK8_DROWI|nr:uncharacterized protein LOC6650995 [Drosophila willistoni]EDW84831.1 uncharacterized protein Dwil_GK14334 [Drosophila willistoni]